MKVLQIIETAYRATIEEQDDTIVWITHAMKGAGGDMDVLLRGDAVNYAVPGQNASDLAFGAWQQTQPPRLDEDIAGLIAKGLEVFIAEEDASDRGLDGIELVDGTKRLPRNEMARLFESYDQIWHW